MIKRVGISNLEIPIFVYHFNKINHKYIYNKKRYIINSELWNCKNVII